ncbi:MAG: hypothetical protein ABF510_08685, partial [Gluconobacter oxydans]
MMLPPAQNDASVHLSGFQKFVGPGGFGEGHDPIDLGSDDARGNQGEGLSDLIECGAAGALDPKTATD